MQSSRFLNIPIDDKRIAVRMAQLQDHTDVGLRYAAQSDVGMRRSSNQDSMAVSLASDLSEWSQKGHLFVVADGMGAHVAGELASKIAVEAIPQAYFAQRDLSHGDALVSAIRQANSQIHERGTNDPFLFNMGTTGSALVLSGEGAIVGQVGDSRVYRFREGRLQQLSFDHSLVWEMRAAGQIPEHEIPDSIPRNVITRSLGPRGRVAVDLEGPFAVLCDDQYLLCSDGLTGVVSDAEIASLLASLEPNESIAALIDLANHRGGPDNITVVVVQVSGSKIAVDLPEAKIEVTPNSKRSPVAAITAWLLAIGLFAGSLATWSILPVQWPIALAFVGFLAAAAASWLSLRSEPDAEPEIQNQWNSSPYTTTKPAPELRTIDTLAQAADQLKETAVSNDWPVDWLEFRRHCDNATAALAAESFTQGLTCYCRAIRSLSAARPPRDDVDTK